MFQNSLSLEAKGMEKVAASIGEKEALQGQERTNGLTIERYFTKPGKHPFDKIEWELRDATIKDSKGNPVFSQQGVEVPNFWSQTATNIVVSKYFRGKIGTEQRESSAKQLISRVAKTIATWGVDGKYFITKENAEAFEYELTHILINQYAAFNSPVWFNVGIEAKPQCSACFINSVQDDMRAILNLAVTEGMLFKYGSGTGSNLSTLRSSKEHLNGGGTASGPLSFMKGFDSFAGAIKSGGKTRRAAKMVILNVDHPDIVDFIMCKAREEKKAWALIDAGYDASIDGEAYATIQYQNANNSVRVTDEFMRAVVNDKEWSTKMVRSGEIAETHRAKDILMKIAEATHVCGDPGMQYDTTINNWHTSPNSGRINASNPCSEYMFLDDTACNLSSINLMKCRDDKQEFDVGMFKHIVKIMTIAKEIIVGFSSYPTPAIGTNSVKYRTLGLGYANLGALLMSRGLGYDSDEGRNFAAAITALMSGHAYFVSAKMAEAMDSCEGYKENDEPFRNVINMHRQAAYKVNPKGVPQELLAEAQKSWDVAHEHGSIYGYRNCQISVLAPTGTISFLMDCDTTGIEPDIALVKYKWLVGGGSIKIINRTVPEALKNLGYSKKQADEILAYLKEKDTIEGAPGLKEEHLPVFDCAFKPANGTRSIHYMGHIKMMGAVQPFISGAISKTVNVPESATVEEIAKTYIEAWKHGVKAVAIYRDGSKRTQALTTKVKEKEGGTVVVKTKRRRLPIDHDAKTHKFRVGTHEGYLTVGLYDDGSPGEIFINMSKEGSTISGLMDSFSIAVSLALQHGTPLKVLTRRFINTRFEPYGYTSNPNIRVARSIVDYIFRWLSITFLDDKDLKELGIPKTAAAPTQEVKEYKQVTFKKDEKKSGSGDETFQAQSDAPACANCGSLMIRSGACYLCFNCGQGTSCAG